MKKLIILISDTPHAAQLMEKKILGKVLFLYEWHLTLKGVNLAEQALAELLAEKFGSIALMMNLYDKSDNVTNPNAYMQFWNQLNLVRGADTVCFVCSANFAKKIDTHKKDFTVPNVTIEIVSAATAAVPVPRLQAEPKPISHEKVPVPIKPTYPKSWTKRQRDRDWEKRRSEFEKIKNANVYTTAA